MKTKLATAVAALKKGNPHDEDTFIGPIIAMKEAERIEAWVKDAMDKGAACGLLKVGMRNRRPAAHNCLNTICLRWRKDVEYIGMDMQRQYGTATDPHMMFGANYIELDCD